MNEDYRPRITAELTPLQMQTLTRILPHGMKKPLFQVLVDGIIEVHTQGGHEALGAIVSRYISLEQLADLGISRKKSQVVAELEKRLDKLLG